MLRKNDYQQALMTPWVSVQHVARVNRQIHAENRECRVLQIMNALSMGGAETWLMALLRYLQTNDDLPLKLRFEIVLTAGGREIFDSEAESLGARLHYIPYSKERLFAFARGFRRVLADGRFHAIHDHQAYAAGIHLLCGWGLLPPVRIVHIHNAIYDVMQHRKFRTAAIVGLEKRVLSRLATQIMGTSRKMISEYGFDGKAFDHVERGAAHCGFDVGRFRGDYGATHSELCREFGWNPTSKIMLFAGRVGAEHDGGDGLSTSLKNPLFALEIAREALSLDNNIRLLMAGGGSGTREKLQEMVRTWNLADKIRLLGVRLDMPRLMVGSDLLLFPSIAEGLGMVTVEAQAAGLPVLASDSTPSECVVIPKIVRFKSLADHPRAWARDALGMMNPPRPEVRECNSRVRASAFSIDNSAARLFELYAGVVDPTVIR